MRKTKSNHLQKLRHPIFLIKSQTRVLTPSFFRPVPISCWVQVFLMYQRYIKNTLKTLDNFRALLFIKSLKFLPFECFFLIERCCTTCSCQKPLLMLHVPLVYEASGPPLPPCRRPPPRHRGGAPAPHRCSASQPGGPTGRGRHGKWFPSVRHRKLMKRLKAGFHHNNKQNIRNTKTHTRGIDSVLAFFSWDIPHMLIDDLFVKGSQIEQREGNIRTFTTFFKVI